MTALQRLGDLTALTLQLPGLLPAFDLMWEAAVLLRYPLLFGAVLALGACVVRVRDERRRGLR